MLKLNRILLASDAPASALGALRYAAPLARLSHAGLQVLRVVDTTESYMRSKTIFKASSILVMTSSSSSPRTLTRRAR